MFQMRADAQRTSVSKPDPANDDRVPWCQGTAECWACGKKWRAVWPMGADNLECPACWSTDTDRELPRQLREGFIP